jgi:hypothetical protein
MLPMFETPPMEKAMPDDPEVDDDMIRALIDEIDVEGDDGSDEWNTEIWIPEYAEPVLGEELFVGLEARLAALPGVQRLAWEDRERFLAHVARGTNLDDLRRGVVDVVRAAVTEAGHVLP